MHLYLENNYVMFNPQIIEQILQYLFTDFW